MAYKNLLVHLDETEACKGRVAAAIALAKAQEAYLTGLALAIETSVPAYIGGQLPVEVLDVQHAQILRNHLQLRRLLVDLGWKTGCAPHGIVVACCHRVA